jgi:hypothetical protein
LVHLPRQTQAGEPERREHQRDDQQHGRDPTDPPLKPVDGRRQDEREQDGTRTACAQYRTATTSTPPANVNQSFTDFNVSSTFVLRSSIELQQRLQCC